MFDVIGIDIDSTINMAHHYDIIHGRELCKEKGFVPTENLNHCSVKEMFGFTPELYNEYMDRYFRWNVRYNRPAPVAPEVIRSLAENHRICIVTARDDKYSKSDYTGDMMVEDTKEWFQRYDIPVHDWFFGAKDKYQVCIDNGIDILIDDDPIHITNCVEHNFPVIVMHQSYNEQFISNPNVFYAYGWTDILRMCGMF